MSLEYRLVRFNVMPSKTMKDGRRVWRPGQWLFLLSLCWVITAGMSAAGLRMSAPRFGADNVFRVSVVSEDGSFLGYPRASWIAVLHSASIMKPASTWSVADGPRTVFTGALFVDVGGDHESNSARFFAARETEPPSPVVVSNAAALRAAVLAAKPGTIIAVAPGTYSGGFYFENVRGQSGSPIIIGAADSGNPPLIRGGGNGMHFSDPQYLELHDLAFAEATGNGLNIDDGGSFETPARHIILRGLRVTDVGPEGNRDGIKLSGVEDFRVENCVVERWGSAGSAIDMVGCHRGVIESNVFRYTPPAAATGANGVQTKGGCRQILIRCNRFEHAGARSVNIGGSTGLDYFRPPLQSGVDHWEAKDICVEGNTFIGSTAPVAYVGVDGAVVRFNTIYRPQRWAIRILQETTAPGFVPCRYGIFTDNIVVFRSDEWYSGGVNIGPNTAPTTFQFARNWWYCIDDPARSRPSLPVAETAGVYGQSPQFIDAEHGDLRLQPDSPARGVGAGAVPSPEVSPPGQIKTPKT